ncbi:ribose-phosphate pyrophosphokinase-like domain-containing protein, partial [Patescibacteria group bacterium]|nr:ribose-phosphate pyrophosphokinase-like domain-containing protein [Patescibacteria group bacterium]
MKASIFSTQSSRYLAELIASRLSDTSRLERTERWAFDDGEQYYRLDIAGRTELMGRDAIFVSSTHTDHDLLEMYRVGCGLADHGTARRIFVIPYFGYSTMEREVQLGEIVTAKKNARLLSAMPNTGS